jgi:hypothetical protein
MEMTRPEDEIRNEIAGLVELFINKHVRGNRLELQAQYAVIRKK